MESALGEKPRGGKRVGAVVARACKHDGWLVGSPARCDFVGDPFGHTLNELHGRDAVGFYCVALDGANFVGSKKFHFVSFDISRGGAVAVAGETKDGGVSVTFVCLIMQI